MMINANFVNIDRIINAIFVDIIIKNNSYKL